MVRRIKIEDVGIIECVRSKDNTRCDVFRRGSTKPTIVKDVILLESTGVIDVDVRSNERIYQSENLDPNRLKFALYASSKTKNVCFIEKNKEGKSEIYCGSS